MLNTAADKHRNLQVTHTSNAMRLLVEGLEKRPDAQVLDVGPVCVENIRFFARRVRRVYVCDLFIQMDQLQREGVPPGEVLKHLDYPPRMFDGVLLWELPDRLEDADMLKLVEVCHHVLKPDGMIMAMNLGEYNALATVNSFVIDSRYQVRMRHQPHLDLPLHVRQSRQFLDMLTHFSLLKSFIYRNGIREFLLKHA